MQIVAVAGRKRTGKTTMVNELARLIVEGKYGLPRVLTFEVTPNATIEEGITHVRAALLLARADEARMLEENHPRGELVVLIDDVCYVAEALMLKEWGATILFIDSDRRLPDVHATWRQFGAEEMAWQYSDGMLPETLFDWHITNYHDLDHYKQEIQMMKDYWIGGMLEV